MNDSVVEEVLTFRCGGDLLPGIVSRPATPCGDLGVVIVVGGPQYRAGSHRQFVLWSRAIATAGMPSMRFDVRGMGDAGGEQRSFTEIDDDIAAAIDVFTARTNIRRVVLAGLCDGASAALLYLDARPDPRVHGVALLNPWIRSAESQARMVVRHYYLRRLTDIGFWSKLLRGEVARSALSEAFAKLRAQFGRHAHANAAEGAADASYQRRMARALAALPGPALVVLSGEDYTAREFADHAAGDSVWRQALALPQVRRFDLPGADHTFSASIHRRQLEQASIVWLTEVCLP
ncbi:MAG: hydrolase 1, exosortase A system-associated [Burkholderiaceae bacterium]